MVQIKECVEPFLGQIELQVFTQAMMQRVQSRALRTDTEKLRSRSTSRFPTRVDKPRNFRLYAWIWVVITMIPIAWFLRDERMAWPYLVNELWGSWASLGWLVLGVAEATWVRYRVLGKDDVLRDPQQSAGFILVFLLMWLAALFSAPLLGQTAWIQSWIGG